jgi:acyl-CoA synthetase (AMP-forming)/AMP-acid ligase II
VGVVDRIQLANDDGLTLNRLAARLAKVHRNRIIAIESSGREWTADALAEQVSQWANVLSTHIASGDRVIVALPNGFPFFAACLAVAQARGVFVPMNEKMTKAEERHVLEQSGATLVLRSTDQLDSARKGLPGGLPPLEIDLEPSPKEIAAIFFTSGTTGLPKGAELTHRGLFSATRRMAAIPIGFRDDEGVIALPVAHIMGFTAYLGAAMAGLRLYAHGKFHAEAVLRSLEQRKSSVFIGVPAMFRMMDEAGAANRNLKSVRVWMSGADAMPPELVRRFQKFGASATLPIVGTTFGEAFFFEGYGMVELSGGAAAKVTPPFAGSFFTKPIGIALPSNELRVVDANGKEVRIGQIGELQVRGPGVLQRYRNDEDATSATVTEDGWLRTGDLARRRPFGSVEFAGRAKDVIKVGGYSVFAAEVQAVLESFDGVAEVSVVGLPDDRLGEIPVAAIRVRDDATVDIDALSAFAEERLAKYKVPRSWLLVDELPRTGSDKVRRQSVRDLFLDAVD